MLEMDFGPLTVEEVDAIRDDPGVWARHHGMLLNESTRALFRVTRPNVLQRRAFAVYKARMLERRPCRLIILKPRGRGGSSAAGIIFYHHLQNFNTFGGIVGTTDEVSENLKEFILKPLAAHDDFPGWSPEVTKDVKGEMRWAHGSMVRTFTASTPESARSARLQAYWASEVGRWPVGGRLDGFETLLSMTGSLPKTGFHLAVQESTPNGSRGAFGQFWNMGRWPEEGDWWEQWQGDSPQQVDGIEGDLQWVRIFAAWFSAFGVGLLWTLVDRDWGRLRHMANLMIAAALLDLVMLLVHRGDLTGSSLQIGLFIAHLAAFGLAGLLMHWLQAARPTTDDRRPTGDPRHET